jgi:hypothetical protein
MKRLARILGALISGAILLLVIALVYSTIKGYMTWYFRVNGSVTVDGHETSGYLHANTERTVLFITRMDLSRPETYLVPLEASKKILDCGEWHPIRFLPNPVGDLNQRCSATNVKQAKVLDSPVGATLVRASRSIEFATASGKKVKAEW